MFGLGPDSPALKQSGNVIDADGFAPTPSSGDRRVRERGGPAAVDQLRALLDFVDRIIDADEFQGCIFVNVAMEFPLHHEPAHIAAAGH